MVGTIADHVHRYSAIHSQKLRTRNRCGITTEPPVSRVARRLTLSAFMWYSGSTHKVRSAGRQLVGDRRVPAPGDKVAVGVESPFRLPGAPGGVDQHCILIRLDLRQGIHQGIRSAPSQGRDQRRPGSRPGPCQPPLLISSITW